MSDTTTAVDQYEALCRDVAAYYEQRAARASEIKRLQAETGKLMKEQTTKHHAAYRLLDQWRRTGDKLAPEQAQAIRDRHGLGERV